MWEEGRTCRTNSRRNFATAICLARRIFQSDSTHGFDLRLESRQNGGKTGSAIYNFYDLHRAFMFGGGARRYLPRESRFSRWPICNRSGMWVAAVSLPTPAELSLRRFSVLRDDHCRKTVAKVVDVTW
jgi:hypothetical protein